ncbi:MAG: ABC transporter permease [Chitinophagaceae bacterium]|nr:ABC transporter permease [Chitinophagaceae bacterium]
MTSHIQQIFRSLFRNRMYSILNITGLAIGLTCFTLIVLWVNDELSYDRFNANYDRIVRVTGTTKTETGIQQSAVTSAPMAAALKQDYPEVELATRITMREDLIELNGQQVSQSGVLVADPSFFDVFSYGLSRGDQRTALNEPYSLILTQTAAKKYFGDADPMGKSLLVYMYDSTGAGANYRITGIMPDPPKNAHFNFSMIASFKTAEVHDPSLLTIDGWGDSRFYTYLLLKPGVDQKKFSTRISRFYAKYVGERYNLWKDIYSYSAQPLKDIHLRSHLDYEIAPNGDIGQVYIFSSIAIFILLLAGINYTNLATARSAVRAKEVGIKKLIGAGKRLLMLSYMSESIITALIALGVSVILALLLQPVFFQLTGKNVNLFASPLLLGFLILTAVITGIVSGIYPAVVLTAFKPIVMLRGAFIRSGKGAVLRRSLVITQFVITLVLVTGIIVVYSQMAFINAKDLGYNKDALLFIRVNGNTDLIKGYSAFRNDLLSNPLVSGVTTSNSLIVGGLSTGGSETADVHGAPLQVNTARLRVDSNYLKVYGIRLLAGKNFYAAANNPDRQVILNATAVRKFGWPNNEAAIGKPFKMGNQAGTVIGVTNDFHFNTLRNAIEPLAIYAVADRFSRISIKIDLAKANESMDWIGAVWKKHFPGALFDFGFVDQQVAESYAAEQRFSRIFLYFSILSLVIACLGLYGLISFTAVQRTREIGIRKVLGASVQRIVFILSGGFLKPVLLACLIAIPLTWYIMNNWLENFAFRIGISWWMFALAIVLVITVALITMSFQTIRAALANPVKSLRRE